MALNCCNQIVTRVPRPDSLVVLTVFNACAEGLALSGAQPCRDFGHVAHVKLMGLRCTLEYLAFFPNCASAC